MSEKRQKSENKTGRPEVVFTDDQWKKINAFLTARADGATIARYFGIHPDTLYAKVVDKYGETYDITTFSAYAALKREEGNELLRRTQFDIAMGGNVTMLIWLGKQYLGQQDTSSIIHGGSIKTSPFMQLLMEATAEMEKAQDINKEDVSTGVQQNSTGVE